MAIRTLTKLLAGAQDLLLGRGTVAQTRNGTSYDIERIALIKPVDLLADIKALPTINPDKQFFELVSKGSLAINDGGGGTYYFDATSTATPDDTLVILPDDIDIANPGRWLKQLAEGVDKAGDTMTGQLKGIPPVSADDFTRKDYVDASYNTFLDGPRNDGTLDSYTGDLNAITVTSQYNCTSASITNEPTAFSGITNLVVETVLFIATDTNFRVQRIYAAGSVAIGTSYIRYTATGSGGWTAWKLLSDAYDSAGTNITEHKETALADTWLVFQNAVNEALVAAGSSNANANLLLTGKGDGFVRCTSTQIGTKQISPLIMVDPVISLESSNLTANAWVTVSNVMLTSNGAKYARLRVHGVATTTGTGGAYELHTRPTGSGIAKSDSVTQRVLEHDPASTGFSRSVIARDEIIVELNGSGEFDWYAEGIGTNFYTTIDLIGFHV